MQSNPGSAETVDHALSTCSTVPSGPGMGLKKDTSLCHAVLAEEAQHLSALPRVKKKVGSTMHGCFNGVLAARDAYKGRIRWYEGCGVCTRRALRAGVAGVRASQALPPD
ncbi:hypothetical protein E2C01_025357 [Portunus trituberculatus]|uniref:Uncharacterized protein n=1 Tax=Portunus trituberculatus TaxID=210409 RepID=A0A5B7EHQ0_PORTR|nr:hypothetical protein [Portunus trituberculatus]